jgi:chemotaxis protein methyltransferase CheR
MAALARVQEQGRQERGRPKSLVDGDFAFTSEDFRAIADMLYADARIHLDESKATLVYSRLVKRLRALELESFEDYCALLGAHEGEAERQEMLSALTTNVTRFFREDHHFAHLANTALPPLLERARKGDRVRIWSAGCSTGEEPYSIALTLLRLAPDAAALDIRILATDIDPNVLARGRGGIYPIEAMADIPKPARQKFLSPVADDPAHFRVGEPLRQLVAFKPLNLNAHWPMRGPFQAIFCRNVVIYFDHATQHGLWRKFAEKLEPSGWLYIGHSERVAGPAAGCFASVGVTAYQRNGRATT